MMRGGFPKQWVSRDGGRPCLRDATPALFELLGSGNKLNGRVADDCLVSVIDSTRSKHLVGAVFEHASVKRAGKAPFVRECCAAYALQILKTWDDVSRLGDNEIGSYVRRSLTCWRIRRNGRARRRGTRITLWLRSGPSGLQKFREMWIPKSRGCCLLRRSSWRGHRRLHLHLSIEPPSGVAEGTARPRVKK